MAVYNERSNSVLLLVVASPSCEGDVVFFLLRFFLFTVRCKASGVEAVHLVGGFPFASYSETRPSDSGLRDATRSFLSAGSSNACLDLPEPNPSSTSYTPFCRDKA